MTLSSSPAAAGKNLPDKQNFTDISDLKSFLAKNYVNQVKNFFGDEKQAMKFMSAVISAVQRNPDLLNTNPSSLINSFMTMAQLQLMPSDVSGEAYVIPYNGKQGNLAQFQIGYQGLITLFYRSGGLKLTVELVRENDDFAFENGEVSHKIDIFKSNKQRGVVVGAYAIAILSSGQTIAKAMNIEDIMRYKEFSKTKNSSFSPWNENSDPEGWMIKKTVLKQLAKLLPKNETINKAIAEDNKDSIISDRKDSGILNRLEKTKETNKSLTMGSMLIDPPSTKKEEEKDQTFEEEINELAEGEIVE